MSFFKGIKNIEHLENDIIQPEETCDNIDRNLFLEKEPNLTELNDDPPINTENFFSDLNELVSDDTKPDFDNFDNFFLENKDLYDIIFKETANNHYIFQIINNKGEHNGHIIVSQDGTTKIIESVFSNLSQNAKVDIEKKALEFFNALK